MKNKSFANNELDEEGFASLPTKTTYTQSPAQQSAAPMQDVATRAEGAMATTAGDNRGMEDVERADLIIPRAHLLQPTAEGLRQLTKDYGVQAGDVVNSLTNEKLGDTFVPIFYYKEFLRFNPRKKEDVGFLPEFAPGKLIWKTGDANDPRVLEQCGWGPNGEKPVALTTLNFFCMFLGCPMPVVLSFSKTSYGAGKNLLSLAKLRGGAMFSRKYKLTTKELTNDQGTYFLMITNPAGDCDAETFKQGEAYFQQFGMKRQDIKTHVEGME